MLNLAPCGGGGGGGGGGEGWGGVGGWVGGGRHAIFKGTCSGVKKIEPEADFSEAIWCSLETQGSKIIVGVSSARRKVRLSR